MIPSKDRVEWRDLLSGRVSHEFEFVAAGLCLSRNIRELRRDNSESAFTKAQNEVYDFFLKYEKLLAEDLKEIFP